MQILFIRLLHEIPYFNNNIKMKTTIIKLAIYYIFCQNNISLDVLN